MDYFTLTKKALRLFESLEITRTRIGSHISVDLYTFLTTMRQQQI